KSSKTGSGREQFEHLFGLSNQDSPRMVQIQRYYGRPADRRLPYHEVVLESKMVRPLIGPRVEEGYPGSGVRICHLCPIRPPQVAAGTGPGEVRQLRRTILRTGDDVLDVEGRPLKRQVHATVFAPLQGALQPVARFQPRRSCRLPPQQMKGPRP